MLDGSDHVVPYRMPAFTSRSQVMVGIRPEHLKPTARRSAALEPTVELVEALGADSLAHGQLAGAARGTAMTVRVDGASRIAAGETLYLAVAPEHVHCFDFESGHRLD